MRTSHMALLLIAGVIAAALSLVTNARRKQMARVPTIPLSPKPGGRTTLSQLRFAVTDDSDFRRMPRPRPGDWLSQFHEPGQTPEQYVAENPVRPSAERRTIVIRPLGEFTAEQQSLIIHLKTFGEAWFDCPFEVLPPIPLPESHRRPRMWLGKRMFQYRTDYLLNEVLLPSLPPHALCYLGITMADLFPDENWNFVFGQASLKDRVAVHSLVRYFPEFCGEPAEEGSEMPLRRACKVLAHETGHMLGLRHCIQYQCTMNGSNSLEESDRRPLALCPPCLAKLQWNIGFDVLDRYTKLCAFYGEHGLTREAEWVEKRMRRIESIGG